MTEHPRRRTDLVVRGTGHEVAVFDPHTATLVQLNATANAIWQACDGETSVAEIVEALVALTGQERSELDEEVRTTIAALTEQHLFERD